MASAFRRFINGEISASELAAANDSKGKKKVGSNVAPKVKSKPSKARKSKSALATIKGSAKRRDKRLGDIMGKIRGGR